MHAYCFPVLMALAAGSPLLLLEPILPLVELVVFAFIPVLFSAITVESESASASMSLLLEE